MRDERIRLSLPRICQTHYFWIGNRGNGVVGKEFARNMEAVVTRRNVRASYHLVGLAGVDTNHISDTQTSTASQLWLHLRNTQTLRSWL